MSLVSDYLTKNIKPSATLAATAKAAELKSQGHPIISLGAGEPDFSTPEYIKIAAINAINNNCTKYTPVGGLKALKEAIISKFKRENNIQYNLNEVSASTGAKQVIYNAMMASLNPGEEVIILAPYWISYSEIVKIAGGVPVVIKPKDNSFKLDIEAIKNAITSKTKWIFINSPNNPSGVVYSYDEIRSIADILLNHKHVHALSDDIYEHLVFDDAKFYTIASVEPKIKDRVLTINGVSKAYCMTGWRLGYGAGPAELIKAIEIIQSQSTSNASSISQMATIAALNGPQDFILEHNKTFSRRRDMAVNLINDIAGLNCKTPQGAFYIFFDCSDLFGKTTSNGIILNNNDDVATYLLEQVYVAVISGSSFGIKTHCRISYAMSDEDLIEACNRIKKACELLR